ncbi:MAG: hypothetical protein AAF462_04870 [Thermodesulfobacteriota bacterium]
MSESENIQSLDTFIRNVQNQEVKGLLLKLKNEMRKPDVTWESVKTILSSIEQKDPELMTQTLSMLIKE